jgi:hypothetical protein
VSAGGEETGTKDSLLFSFLFSLVFHLPSFHLPSFHLPSSLLTFLPNGLQQFHSFSLFASRNLVSLSSSTLLPHACSASTLLPCVFSSPWNIQLEHFTALPLLPDLNAQIRPIFTGSYTYPWITPGCEWLWWETF